MQMTGAHREARIVEAHEGSDRHFGIWRDPSASRHSRRRLNLCRERGADTGPAIGVAQPAHLEVGERYEFSQMISAVGECGGIGAQVERAKGRRQLTRSKIDCLSVTGCEYQCFASVV